MLQLQECLTDKMRTILTILFLLVGLPDRDAMYYYRWAELDRENGDFKSAYVHYSKAIELDNQHYNAYLKRALLKVDMDSAVSSLKDFDKAISIVPNSGEAYFYRANTKWTLKDSVGACSDWKTACDFLYGRACDVRREHCKR